MTNVPYQREESLLVFASGPVGERCLRFLLERGDPIGHVFAGASKDDGIMALCRERKVPHAIFSLGSIDTLLKSGRRFAWLLNLWSPHILSPLVLATAEHRLNIHPSLAPIARGNDNAAWCLRRALPAGVSLLEMTARVDEGDVYAQRQVPWEFPMRGRDLHEALQNEAIQLFMDFWPEIHQGAIRPLAQKGAASCFTRRLTEIDRRRDAGEMMSLAEWVTWALAHDFHPGTTALMVRADKLYSVRVTVDEVSDSAPVTPEKKSGA